MLTPAQLATLKADIVGDAALNAHPNNGDGNTAIVAAYLLNASPDYWVWKTFVSDQEIYGAVVETLVWSWTIFIARSQGERDAWRQLVNMAGGINPSLPQVRTGIADIFSGAGGLAQRNYLLALSRRKANRGEKLFASGAGTTAAPSVMAFEGMLTTDDIQAARLLP